MMPGCALISLSVERLRTGTTHRRTGNRSVHHARDLHVAGVQRLAGHLVGEVDARNVLADQAEPILRLELLGLDRRQVLRRLGKRRDFAVADLPVGAGMDNRAEFGRELADRHVPALRHRVDQNLARLRARHAAWHPVTARGDAGHHELRLEDRVVVGGGDRRLLDLDLRPVGVQLLGDDQGQRGVDALPHLRRRSHDGDRAVGCNGDIGVELACGLRLRAFSRRPSANANVRPAEPASMSRRLRPREPGLMCWFMFSPPARRVRWHARCADRCRSGRCCRPCVRRSARGSASWSSPAVRRPA